jgi:hypothetical protein
LFRIRIIIRFNISNLRALLNTIHIFPLSNKFKRSYLMMFSRKDINGALRITRYKKWKWANKLHLTYISRKEVFNFKIPSLEIPKTNRISFAMSCNKKLIGTKSPTTKLFLPNIINISQNILPRLYFLQMVRVIMNLYLPIPTPRD